MKGRLFRRNEQGNATIEAAILLPVLIGLTAIISEAALLLYAQANLNRAARSVADIIRFESTSNLSEAALRQAVCDLTLTPLTCAQTRMTLQVLPATETPPSSGNVYNLPGSSEAVMVRLTYRWFNYFPVSTVVTSDPSALNPTLYAVAIAARENLPPPAPPPTTGGLVWN